MKEIKIGLIGYIFMGKSHSRTCCDVRIFFDLPVIPVMRVICGLE